MQRTLLNRRSQTLTLLACSWLLLLPPFGFAQEESSRSYIGEIIIVGNTVTKDEVIRKQVGLSPGQVLRESELRKAEEKLKRLGIFNNDPKQGNLPSVTVMDTPGPHKDILIKVEETRTGSLLLGVGFTPRGVVFLSVVLEERNFDPLRWPTSMAELSEGHAFRGAGQKFRLEWRIPFASRLRSTSARAAVSNPVAQGIPVHRLPPEYLATPGINKKRLRTANDDTSP